jgi:hypothetical protein
MIGEFVAHDSIPRFGSLNHGLGASLNTLCREYFGRYAPKSGRVMLTLGCRK